MGFTLNYVDGRPLTMSLAIVFVALALCVSTNLQASAQAPEKRRTGNVCSTDPECPDNAFCKASSYCVCKDGFIYSATEDGKACLKVSSYGDPCTEQIQCHTSLGVHSECYIYVCSCKTGTQFVNDRCYKKALIGERCISDFNCYVMDAPTEEQAFCVRGFCQCQVRYSPRNSTLCVRDAMLGEACEDDLQCAGVGMECKGTCRCRQGFTAYDEGKICLESVEKLGDPCIFDAQCHSLAGVRGVDSTMCMNGVCSCSYYNARAAGSPPRCWVIRRPGEQCRADEECLSEDDEPGFCYKGHCSCAACVPDARDFADHASSLAPLPLIAAILTTAAILA